MSYSDNEAVFVLFIGIVFGIITTCVMFSTFHRTYKDGQIDAIQGKIKYKLEVQPNGETIWKERNEQK